MHQLTLDELNTQLNELACEKLNLFSRAPLGGFGFKSVLKFADGLYVLQVDSVTVTQVNDTQNEEKFDHIADSIIMVLHRSTTGRKNKKDLKIARKRILEIADNGEITQEQINKLCT